MESVLIRARSFGVAESCVGNVLGFRSRESEKVTQATAKAYQIGYVDAHDDILRILEKEYATAKHSEVRSVLGEIIGDIQIRQAQLPSSKFTLDHLTERLVQ